MTLTVTADTLASLGTRADVVAAFPFLKPRPPKAACCGKKAVSSGSDPAARLANLPPARKAAFKALVGADTVAVLVVRAARVVRVEF